MNPWAELLWIVMGLGLVVYSVTGGADLGAGVWTLLARGPDAPRTRKAVHDALAPIWEANHVWLIFLIVVMFSAFSRAFAVMSVALHVPIALALLGLVLRGSGFVFHAYGLAPEGPKAAWAMVFSVASVTTCFFLGDVLAALGTGDILVADGAVQSGYLAGWTTPFALLVGLFTVSLFAMLSAAYLAGETTDVALSKAFARRAVVAECTSGALSFLVLWRASKDAPLLYRGLMHSGLALTAHAVTALLALATVLLMVRGKARLARLTAPAQVGLVVLGFGAAMDHHFFMGSLTVSEAVTYAPALAPISLTLGAGSLLLIPSLFYLLHLFKKKRRAELES